MLYEICNSKVPTNLLIKKKNKRFLTELYSRTKFLDGYYESVKLSQRVWHVKNMNFSVQRCLCYKPKKFSRSYVLCGACRSLAVGEKIKNRTEERKNEIRELRRKASLKKYGVENPIQNNDIKAKNVSSHIKNHGFMGLASKEIMSKMQETCKERYGNKKIT